MTGEPSPVAAAFEPARREGRALLIGYWPAGYPNIEASRTIIAAMIAGGVDMVEVGIPYSDPLMDGPVIASAVEHALAAGITPPDAISLVADIAELGVPTLVMTYWNLIEQYGPERFATDLADAGGVGVIAPDLTVEESDDWIRATDAAGLSRVFLAAPSSDTRRLRVVSDATNGFVYAASLMGVTGTRNTVSQDARDLVTRLRQQTSLPVAVGLGVSTPQQAHDVAGYADGVIVGSAFVKLMGPGASIADTAGAVRDLAGQLANAIRDASRDSGADIGKGKTGIGQSKN